MKQLSQFTFFYKNIDKMTTIDKKRKYYDFFYCDDFRNHHIHLNKLFFYLFDYFFVYTNEATRKRDEASNLAITFSNALSGSFIEVMKSVSPIVGIFVLYQLISFLFHYILTINVLILYCVVLFLSNCCLYNLL